jgi:GntR family carbon starvation induced transcriptional regulator
LDRIEAALSASPSTMALKECRQSHHWDNRTGNMRTSAAERSGRTAQKAADNMSNQAFESIRQDILECRLKPDSRLTLDELRERYNVGATPLREALMRLTTDGLVVFTQNRGFRVASVSKEDLIDAMATQIELTRIAFSKSIELGDDQWEGDLISSFHRLSKLKKYLEGAGRRMNPEWSKVHREFHYNLVRACGSRWLLNFIEAITDQTTRYVRLSIEALREPRVEETEHRDIMNAALARDTEKACRLLEAHFVKTRDNLLKAKPSIF